MNPDLIFTIGIALVAFCFGLAIDPGTWSERIRAMRELAIWTWRHEVAKTKLDAVKVEEELRVETERRDALVKQLETARGFRSI